jgi:hypothetical protein
MVHTIRRLPAVKAEAEAESGSSRSTIDLRIRQGLWPKPVKLGTRSIGWPRIRRQSAPGRVGTGRQAQRNCTASKLFLSGGWSSDRLPGWKDAGVKSCKQKINTNLQFVASAFLTLLLRRL